MKRVFAPFILASLTMPAVASELTVNITNLNNEKGQVLVALYNSPEKFPDADGKYKGTKIKPLTAKTVSTLFTDLPPGKYAVVTYHDEDDNDKLDKSFWGKPTEQYGFSNNAVPNMGPPSFKDAEFSLSKGQSETINIKLSDK